MMAFIFRAIAALFKRSPAAAPQAPVGPRLEPAVSATTVVLPAAPAALTTPVLKVLTAAPDVAAGSASPTRDPAPAAVAPLADPDAWLALCRPLVEHFESCYLSAYPDPGSPLAKALLSRGLWQRTLAGAPIPADLRSLSGAPWTCGYGTTGPDVVMGTQWTQAYASSRLDRGLAGCSGEIDAAVKVLLTPAQKAALGSLLYNVGPGRAAHGTDAGRDGIVVLASGRPSTLLAQLNLGNYAAAAAQILVWDKSGGATSAGLDARRVAERQLFLTGAWE